MRDTQVRNEFLRECMRRKVPESILLIISDIMRDAVDSEEAEAMAKMALQLLREGRLTEETAREI